MPRMTVHFSQASPQDPKFVQLRINERARFPRGEEIEVAFIGSSPLEGFAMARKAAQIYAGLITAGAPLLTVPFVSNQGPYAGHVLGSQTGNGKQGWRIDWSPRSGDFHVNWWDRRLDVGGNKDRTKQYYGANIVVGGAQDLFWQIEAHFPGHVERS